VSALYRRRPEVVEALQVNGDNVTTEEQVKAIDPKANVNLANVDPSLQWVILSNGQAIQQWGDWIVRSVSRGGRLRVFTATQFAIDYQVIL